MSYTLIDKDNYPIGQGIGRTLNVSEGGILLQTHSPLDARNTLLLTIGLEDDLTEFEGQIIYTRALQEKRYEHGIKFIRLDEKKLSFLKQYIVMFDERKSNE